MVISYSIVAAKRRLMFDSAGKEGRDDERRGEARGAADMHRNESSGLRAKRINHGEFDPGSERTLAARLKHASRAGTGSLLPARAADW